MHSPGKRSSIALNRRFALLATIIVILLTLVVLHVEEITQWSANVWHPVDIPGMRVGEGVSDGKAESSVGSTAKPKIETEVLPPDVEDVKHKVPPVVAGPATTAPTTASPATGASKGQTGWYKKAPKHVEDYFTSAFGSGESKVDLAALEHYCNRVEWQKDEVYMECKGFGAGVTSIMSEIKVCLKQAIEAGTGLILPRMPIRDKENIAVLNQLNPDALRDYEEWFDAPHLIKTLNKHCPQLKLVHPSRIDGTGPDAIPVKQTWDIDIEHAPQYQFISGYFWTGRPWRTYFDQKYREQQTAAFLDPDRDNMKQGATVLTVGSYFLLFRITDDPTHGDLRLWNALNHLIRFKSDVRTLVSDVASKITRPYYAVHFRAENDTIWSTPEAQLKRDLEALDIAWEKLGSYGAKKPMVYLACGDIDQVRQFQQEGAIHGWEVTHKWELLKDDQPAIDRLAALEFDFQGGIDYGLMLKGDFFLGIIGSAFSSTIGHNRDPTGRYRGSSFLVEDDGGAHTHLFNDLDSTYYACCL